MKRRLTISFCTTPYLVIFCILLLPALMPPSYGAGPKSSEKGAWVPLRRFRMHISELVSDTDNRVWSFTNNGLFYWEMNYSDSPRSAKVCNAFKQKEINHLKREFFGGLDRDIYLTGRLKDKSRRKHYGLLYYLKGTELVKVSEYYFDNSNDNENIYVSRSNRAFNYTGRFVAILDKGKWTTVETPLADSYEDVHIHDLSPEGPVIFFNNKSGNACIWNGNRFQTGMPESFPSKEHRIDDVVSWGRNRILFFMNSGRGSKRMLCVKWGKEPQTLDITQIRSAIPSRISNAWGAPDGSVLMQATPGNRKNKPKKKPYLIHLAPDGKVTDISPLPGQRIKFNSWKDRRSIVQTQDGTFWLILVHGGILRIKNLKPDIFNWRKGYVYHGPSWLVKTPNNNVVACGEQKMVSAWDPNAIPDTFLTERWASFQAVNYFTIQDPNGGIWAFLDGHPKQASRWDGKKWTHCAIGVEVPHNPNLVIVDDIGGMLFQANYNSRDIIYLTRSGERQIYKSHNSAIAAAAKEGARYFRVHKKSYFKMKGPVVTNDGRIWYQARKTRHLIHFYDKAMKWQRVNHSPLHAITESEDGKPLFLDKEGVWSYESGRIINLSEKHPKVNDLALYPCGEFDPKPIPYYKNLPSSFLSEHVIKVNSDSQWYPVSIKTARKIEMGIAPPPPPNTDAKLKYQAFIMDRECGFWVSNQRRWAGGDFTPYLKPRNLPVSLSRWRPIAHDKAGRTWISGGGYDLYMQKSQLVCPEISKMHIQRSRRLFLQIKKRASFSAFLFRQNSVNVPEFVGTGV